jgi:copper chaperone CopZ
VNAEKKALDPVLGVSSTEIDLGANTVTVEYDAGVVSLDIICNKIQEQGYDVIS